ncbi:GlsB/YeaQ/YmgE family stress response membrane protein [Enterococcus raffinosus]|uniref:General stress protein GlsB n=1 Tax=Enterococcus raffinosus ATCC 49464 TaxID=1158602 RepID=R2P1J7_9ENTE|nr:GlsB/YeaQ/YmgE family stress response membrane protein [Enterococcus raffinosus]EOH77118.1 general stress protein GlsB [Enterococcus raffinosus ATCC 49464]EOT75811.1 general stress protein GlsB [Enterococcus raffinosus ATCC 49464]UXK05808.1 GlsB/YeaQ/YmgE family stress response membrane protein [Enterococcus raffinosus]
MIWTLIVGAVIGAIGGSLSGRGKQMGCLFNIIAGLAGSYIGQAIFGHSGPHLAGMALVPSILGAVVVVAVVSLFTGRR